MSALRSVVATQLVATGVMVLVQAGAGSPAVFESGVGAVAAAAWLVLSLAAFFGAALKAYDNQQYKWLAGIVFVWPLMYPFVFKYAHPGRY